MSIPWSSQKEGPLQGIKYLQLLGTLLTDLHHAGAERDRAGHRDLFYDQYALLFLLYYYNPTITSLRGLQRTTELGCRNLLVFCSILLPLFGFIIAIKYHLFKYL